MKKYWSTRNRLILINILTFFITILVLGLITPPIVGQVMQRSVDDSLLQLARPMMRPPRQPGGQPGGQPNGQPGGQMDGLPDQIPNSGVRSSSGSFPAPINDSQNNPKNDGPPPNFDMGPPPNGFGPPDAHPKGNPAQSQEKSNYFPPINFTKGQENTAYDPNEAALFFQKAAAPDEHVFTTVEYNSEELRVLTFRSQRRGRNGPPLGFIDSNPPPPPIPTQIAVSLSGVNRAVNLVRMSMLGLIPLGLLGAVIGGFFTSRGILSQVSKLALSADAIQTDDLSARLPKLEDDEFGMLSNVFNRLLERVEHAFQAQKVALEKQRQFTADASHELKTPLTVIKGRTSLALGKLAEDAPLRPTLEAIETSADAMNNLVQSLLILAQSDAEQLGRNRESILMSTLLDNTHLSLSEEDVSRIRIVALQPVNLFVNKYEFQRGVLNLMSNALRYSPRTSTVEIKTNSDGDKVKISIIDQGSGMTAAELSRLGERFYRADASRTRESGGSGLGVAIARALIEANGGFLSFESEVGKGTCAKIEMLKQ